MKMFLVLMLTAGTVWAQDNAPFGPDVYKRFKANEAVSAVLRTDVDAARPGTAASAAAYAADGISQKRIARAVYDVAVDLGTIAAHPLGVSLPAGALVTQSWFYVVTQFTDTGSGTVALHCEDANNIYTAADITGISAGTITAGNQTGVAADMTAAIGAACELTATVATNAQTAGKLILFVEFVVVE